MGQSCSDEGEWCQSDVITRQKTRQKFTESKVGQKDLIQTKKTPLSYDYTIVCPAIGKGSFGSVYKIIHKQTGMERVAKKLSKKTKKKQYAQEILLLKKLDHPNIVRILDIYEEELFIFLVMEYCAGGQLFDRINTSQTMTESVAKFYMKQLLGAVSYCHLNHVMHRDLKPQNIMVVSENAEDLKIVDFGAAKILEKDEHSKAKVGSVYYIAPEVLKKDYDEKCDIWSLGVILYMMLSGTAPFSGRTDKAIFESILNGKFSFPQKRWGSVSEQAKDLISKMLIYDPKERISAKKALNHSWFLREKVENQKNLYLHNQMESMKKFCQMTKFQSNIITFMTHNLMTSKSLAKLEKKFNEMDKNNDGRISWNQFKDCYLQVMDPLSEQEIQEMFIKLDKNNSGYIDYSEFVSSTSNQEKLLETQLISKAFRLIDSNRNGYLNKEEIVRAFGGMNEEIYEQMLEESDLDKDGQISEEEFIKAMRNLVRGKK